MREVLLLVRLRESLSSALPLFRRLAKERERLLKAPRGLEVPRRQVLKQPNRKLSPDAVDELVAAYLDGESIQGLSRRFGTHYQTTRRHLLRRGVNLRDVPGGAPRTGPR